MLYVYIALIFIQLGVIIYFVKRNRSQNKSPIEKTESVSESGFEEWRLTALQVNEKHLKITVPEGSLLVYGVVMDWNLGGSFMTVAAYVTGAANMCLSSGEIYAGGGLHPAVSAAAVAFVGEAQDKLERCVPTETTQLPYEGFIRFSLLTNRGRYAGQEELVQVELGNSPWMNMFASGSRLMQEIRQYAAENAAIIQ